MSISNFLLEKLLEILSKGLAGASNKVKRKTGSTVYKPTYCLKIPSVSISHVAATLAGAKCHINGGVGVVQEVSFSLLLLPPAFSLLLSFLLLHASFLPPLFSSLSLPFYPFTLPLSPISLSLFSPLHPLFSRPPTPAPRVKMLQSVKSVQV